MLKSRWSSIQVFAFAIVVLGGVGFAQPEFRRPLLGSEWASRIFVVFDHAFATDAADRELGTEMILAMRSGAGVAVDDLSTQSTCAHVLGAGGNPKLDGGGNLLAVMPAAVQPSFIVIEPEELASGMTPLVDTIVIIDEFQLDVLRATILSTTLNMDEDDALQELWNTFYAHVPADGDVPHGHLVAYHALAHLGGTDAEITVDSTVAVDATLGLTVAFGDGRTVRVLLVTIAFDDLSSLVTVRNVLSEFLEANAVIVTSWGLVDCALGEGYAEAATEVSTPADATFVEYLRSALAGGDAETQLESLCSAFEERINQAIAPESVDCDGDFEALLDLGTIAAVAAMSVQASEDVGVRQDGDWANVTSGMFASAGNQGLAFPMPPAAWPGVIGVEACTPDQGRASFSNVGSLIPAFDDQSVRALGAWFATNEWSGGTRLGYWGTSFAAPAAAMFYAATDKEWMNITMGGTAVLPPCGP